MEFCESNHSTLSDNKEGTKVLYIPEWLGGRTGDDYDLRIGHQISPLTRGCHAPSLHTHLHTRFRTAFQDKVCFQDVLISTHLQSLH